MKIFSIIAATAALAFAPAAFAQDVMYAGDSTSNSGNNMLSGFQVEYLGIGDAEVATDGGVGIFDINRTEEVDINVGINRNECGDCEDNANTLSLQSRSITTSFGHLTGDGDGASGRLTAYTYEGRQVSVTTPTE